MINKEEQKQRLIDYIERALFDAKKDDFEKSLDWLVCAIDTNDLILLLERNE